jgi:hypothetical protein
MLLFKTLVLTVTFTTAVLSTQGQRWILEIKPLDMSVSDVSRMTGKQPEYVSDDQVVFRWKESNLFVGRSTGHCNKTSWGFWDVPAGTIIQVMFHSSRKLKPGSLNLPVDGMIRDNDHGHDTFTSDERGLYYAVQFGVLSGLTIYPGTRLGALKCGENRAS